MELTGNTILITGGASGIGFSFAERFLKAGNTVIICGRREEKLFEAKQKYPELHTRVCDLSVDEERCSLFEWVKNTFPELNMLVNNAGIQQRVNLTDKIKDWSYYKKEITINVEAPIHLSMLFIHHLINKDNATIINITSGLAFTPLVVAPIYSSTKAAMHSFTMSLRQQIYNDQVEVIEVAPPAVNTDLGGPGLHTFGAPLDEFTDAIFKGFEQGEIEIGFGRSEKARRMSREEIDKAFIEMNKRL